MVVRCKISKHSVGLTVAAVDGITCKVIFLPGSRSAKTNGIYFWFRVARIETPNQQGKRYLAPAGQEALLLFSACYLSSFTRTTLSHVPLFHTFHSFTRTTRSHVPPVRTPCNYLSNSSKFQFCGFQNLRSILPYCRRLPQ